MAVNGEKEYRPGPADEEPLSPEEAKSYRSIAAKFNYLGQDSPHLQFGAKVCSQDMSGSAPDAVATPVDAVDDGFALVDSVPGAATEGGSAAASTEVVPAGGPANMTDAEPMSAVAAPASVEAGPADGERRTALARRPTDINDDEWAGGISSRPWPGWSRIVLKWAPASAWRQKVMWIAPGTRSDDVKWYMMEAAGCHVTTFRLNGCSSGYPYRRFDPVALPPPNGDGSPEAAVCVMPSMG